MTTKITSREVLSYLNKLGYENINAQQLKEFVHDLKKLIKYEERKKSKNKVLTEADIPPLYLQETCASKAKVAEKKQSVISLQIKKSKCTNCAKKIDENHNKIDNVDEVNDVNSDNQTNEEVTSKEEEMGSGKIKKKKIVRQKSSTMKPTTVVSHKNDPVSMYHYYKNIWDQHKLPGEDNRSELRWAIREKLSQPPKMYKT